MLPVKILIFPFLCVLNAEASKVDINNNVSLVNEFSAKSELSITNVTKENIIPNKPVKLTMKQGLLMNQVLAVYALDNAKSEICKNHSTKFKNALRAFEPWALQMFDSSSKLQSGILLGNLVDYGSYYQCLGIYKNTDSGPIIGKHCVVKVKPSIELIEKTLEFRNVSKRRFQKILMMVEKSEIGWSVCVPKSCPSDDIIRHFNKTIQEITEGLALDVSLDENYCNTLDDGPEMGLVQYLIIIFLGSFIVTGIITAIADYRSNEQTNVFVDIFSTYTNLQKIFAPETTNNKHLSFLNGLRIFSSCTIVMGHRYIMYMMFPVVNQLESLDWLLKYSSTLILGSTVCVDSFFMVSGMLVCIGFFDYVTKNGKFNLFLFYIHRYLRITLPLAMVVLFYCTLAQFLAYGPFMYDIYKVHQKPCQDYWWSTLLHIQAYVNPGTLCIYPTWYLSCEMLFYFFSPLILYPLWKCPKFGIVNSILIYILSMAGSFYLAWINEYEGELLPITNQLFDTKYFQRYYITPHTRVSPYIIGIIFGYIIFRTKEKPVKIKKWLNISAWILSLTIMIFCIVSSHTFQLETHEYNRLESSLNLSFSRSAWTLGIVWMMWSCLNGYGGVINEFLSAHLFRVLGRITYGIFLLHSILQVYKNGSAKTPMYLSDFHVVYDGAADLFLIFIIAFLFTIFYELPLIRAEGLLFKPIVPKKVKPDIWKIN